MIEILPYILIIIGWSPGDNEAAQIVSQELMLSEADCQSLGARLVAERGEEAQENEHAGYSYICAPAPREEDYQRLFQQEIEPDQ